MARKTLLNEQEIRQFMKLANLSPLGDAKIEELYGKAHNRDDKSGDEDNPEDVHNEAAELDEMGMGPAYDRDEEDEEDDMMAADAAVDVADDLEDDAAERDVDDQLDDMGGEADEMTLSDEEADAILALADKIRAAKDDSAPEEMDVEEPSMDIDGLDDDDEEPIEMSEEDENAPKGGDSMLEGADEDDIVAEVARRVADRLKASQQKEQMVDQLAERILNRLTNK